MVQTSDWNSYASRLSALDNRWWRRWIDVQAPYRAHLRGLHMGFTLDVGAGVGRNLAHLGGNGVGVEISAQAVRAMRERGLRAFEPKAFLASEFAKPGLFDSLLIAHVLEHMPRPEAIRLVAENMKYVKRGGRIVLITPQEAGQRSDPTHVAFLDAKASSEILRTLGINVERTYSFPFPRYLGRIFKHNETVVIGRV